MTQKMHKVSRSLATLAVSGMVFLPGPATRAAIPVIDPTNLVQNVITAVQQTLNVVQEIQAVANQGTQIAQQVQQLQHELEMLQNMAINTTPGATVAWGEVQTALATLGHAVQTGLSIPYELANVASVFESRFPGYSPPTDWNAAYNEWSTTVLDTLRGTLDSAGLNVADSGSVQAALDGLRSANDGARGRLEALQVGNQIASLQVEEVTKLRQLMATQINSQNAYLGGQEAKQAGAAAAFERWVTNRPALVPVSRPPEGFDSVPRP